MNFRNILEIAVISLNCILFNEENYVFFRMEPIFRNIKIGVIKFVSTTGLIKRKDGARLYFQYVFNTMESYSLCNCLVSYYKNNLDDNDNYIDTSDKVYQIFKQFIDFYTSKEIIECLKIMDADNRFVTGFVEYRYILAILAKMLFKMINSDEFKSNTHKLKGLLNTVFRSFEDAVVRHKSNGMRISELDNFYKDSMISEIGYEVKNNKVIEKIYFDNYFASLTSTYDETIKSRKNIEDYHEFIDLVYECCERDDYIIKLLDWYFEKVNIGVINMIYEYINISFGHLRHDSILYENKEKLKELIYEKIENKIKDCSDEEIHEIASRYDIKISSKLSKTNKIKTILENIKKDG